MKGNTPRIEAEDEFHYTDRRSNYSRKRSRINSKSSVSKIFAMGDKRSQNHSRHSALGENEDSHSPSEARI